MAYCVKCGVKLSGGKNKCPLCGTKVYNVEEKRTTDRPFPKYVEPRSQRVSKKSVVSLISLLFMLPMYLAVVCDITINKTLIWSGYVIGAFLVLGIAITVPIITEFKRKYLCAFLDGLCLAIYLYYIEISCNGYWFLGLALPIIILITLMVINIMALLKKASALKIAASIFIMLGLLCLAIEVFVNMTFKVRTHLAWSVYPLITNIILSVGLLIIDKSEALKEKLEKKFFI
ncbi:MAG: DUF6320 domain-containing protein [Bacillota bacterium]|nr:DUF6320 domain-containing protein [Bacillota bacterium]